MHTSFTPPTDTARRAAAELLRHPISLLLSAGSVDLLHDLAHRSGAEPLTPGEHAWVCQAMIAAIALEAAVGREVRP